MKGLWEEQGDALAAQFGSQYDWRHYGIGRATTIRGRNGLNP